MLGREVNQPADLLYRPPDETPREAGAYVADLTEAMRSAHEAARTTLRTAQERMKRNYDLRVYKKAYVKGYAVYLLDTAKIKGKCKKLSPSWKGPGVVIKVITSYLYTVKFRKSIMTVNHDRLKKCQDTQLPAWLIRARKTLTEHTDHEEPIYCVCRRPHENKFMIQCDSCDEWYHGTCVSVTPEDASHLDKYACPLCSANSSH